MRWVAYAILFVQIASIYSLRATKPNFRGQFRCSKLESDFCCIDAVQPEFAEFCPEDIPVESFRATTPDSKADKTVKSVREAKFSCHDTREATPTLPPESPFRDLNVVLVINCNAQRVIQLYPDKLKYPYRETEDGPLLRTTMKARCIPNPNQEEMDELRAKRRRWDAERKARKRQRLIATPPVIEEAGPSEPVAPEQQRISCHDVPAPWAHNYAQPEIEVQFAARILASIEVPDDTAQRREIFAHPGSAFKLWHAPNSGFDAWKGPKDPR